MVGKQFSFLKENTQNLVKKQLILKAFGDEFEGKRETIK